MKKFKEYISEDIEVLSGNMAMFPTYFPSFDSVRKAHERKGETDEAYEYKDHGDLTPESMPTRKVNYSLHHFTHSIPESGWSSNDTENSIYIVHNESNRIVGKIGALGYSMASSRNPQRHDLRIEEVEVEPAHREREIGHSLAVAAYRTLNRAGHGLRSSSLQTFGGAKLWNRLRNDPELGSRMVLYNPNDESSVSAGKLSTKHIWGSAGNINVPRHWQLQPEINPETFEKKGMMDSYLYIPPPERKK